jgi:hypothetical protein
MFKLMGDSPDKAAVEAETVMRIETALAKGASDRVGVATRKRSTTSFRHRSGRR